MNTNHNSSLLKTDRQRYSEVGYCIYCGATQNLSDEHIVPFGLGGNLILPRASCQDCAKITSQFEMKVLRGPLRAIRVFKGIQSRSKHRDAPTLLPLRVQQDNEWETIQLPHHEYPLIYHLFNFGLPGYLDPKNYSSGVRISGNWTYSFGSRPEEVSKRLGVKQVRISQNYDPNAFAKMTAKIAYCMAVATGALNLSQGQPELVQSLLGKVDEIGKWVGTLPQSRQQTEGLLHFIAIERDIRLGLLMGKVQYLSEAGTPVYSVILGRLDEKFIRES